MTCVFKFLSKKVFPYSSLVIVFPQEETSTPLDYDFHCEAGRTCACHVEYRENQNISSPHFVELIFGRVFLSFTVTLLNKGCDLSLCKQEHWPVIHLQY